MSKNQTGFGLHGIILVVLVIGTVVGSGWLVWHRTNNHIANGNMQNNNNVSHSSDIPGEMQLSLGKTVIYKNKDGGCHTFTNDFGPYTNCYTDTLMSYKPSGNIQTDENSIAEQFVQQQRGWKSVNDVTFPPVPFSLSVNQLGSGDSRTGNAGLCLIIIDKSQTNPKGCASQTDYQALRSVWPNNEANYTVGVIYITFR